MPFRILQRDRSRQQGNCRRPGHPGNGCDTPVPPCNTWPGSPLRHPRRLCGMMGFPPAPAHATAAAFPVLCCRYSLEAYLAAVPWSVTSFLTAIYHSRHRKSIEKAIIAICVYPQIKGSAARNATDPSGRILSDNHSALSGAGSSVSSTGASLAALTKAISSSPVMVSLTIRYSAISSSRARFSVSTRLSSS